MSYVNPGPDAPENEQNDGTDTVTADKPDNAPGAQPEGNKDNLNDSDVFPRSYVEELRKENADYRTKADKLAKRLHTELVKATNRLENPADLAYDAEHLDGPDKLTAALDALLADRPYFAKRVVKGDAGQGPRGNSAGGATFADLLRR